MRRVTLSDFPNRDFVHWDDINIYHADSPLVSAGPPFPPHFMAEDLHVKRYFAPLKAGIQLMKTYVNISHRANLDNAQTRPTRGQRQMAGEARMQRNSRLTESVCLFPGWAVRHYIDNGEWRV